MDESRWSFGEKDKDFLVATPRNFSNNKRINPKRFRHLNQGLGLHQGFQGSPINRGLHNTILHQFTIKNIIP